MMPAPYDSPWNRSPSPARGADPLVICGAGAAGIAAALAAARSGVPVWLVEASARVGGTVASALIHTLGGLYDSRGERLQVGLGAELIDRLESRDPHVRRRRMGRLWVLNVCPKLYRNVVEEWIATESNIRLLTRSRVSRTVCEGGRVTQVEIAGRGGCFSLRPRQVIDTTGTAELVRRIDANLVQSGTVQASGLIFRMRGVVPGSLDFPRGVLVVQALRAAAADGTLPPTCDKAWIDTGVWDDEAFVKLFVPLPPDWRDHRCAITRQARRVQAAVADFLTRLPQFAQAKVVQCGRLGIRDGGRIHGEYCLTGDDVRRMRKFDDAACRGCWPMEYWDVERGVSVEYLPEDDYYEIPLRCLKVWGLANVWTAGKSLSADPLAHASARIAGTCWAMGEAVGKAAGSV